MAFQDQFGAEGETCGTEAPACALCQALLPEAVDGSLSAAEQAMFDRHVAGCADCALELEEAQRGAAWLSLLKNNAPEPPSALLDRILADTTGLQGEGRGVRVEAPTAVALVGVPPAIAWMPMAAKPSWWASLRTRLTDAVRIEHSQANFHPRFAMTAAMAFFSIALTLNIAGVHLRDLRADDFTSSGVRRAVADAGASAERRFQNLRVVYQMESRVEELRADDKNSESGSEKDTAPAQPTPQQSAPADGGKSKPGQPHGSSHLQYPNMAVPKVRSPREAIS